MCYLSYFITNPKAKNVLEVYNEAKKLRENTKKKNELDKAILSCDEKAGIQAIGNKYPDLMASRGKISHNCKR